MRTMHLAAHHKMGKGKGKMGKGKGKGRQPRLSTHSMRSSPVPRTGACTTVQRLLMKGTHRCLPNPLSRACMGTCRTLPISILYEIY
jgi:hypothetical protein